MGLDRLRAEEELGRDFGIGLAVGDEPCELELTRGQGLESSPVGASRPRAAVDAIAEPAQLAFRLISVADRSALLEDAGRASKLGRGAITLAGFGERGAGHRARERCLDRRPGLVGGRRGRECLRGCTARAMVRCTHGDMAYPDPMIGLVVALAIGLVRGDALPRCPSPTPPVLPYGRPADGTVRVRSAEADPRVTSDAELPALLEAVSVALASLPGPAPVLRFTSPSDGRSVSGSVPITVDAEGVDAEFRLMPVQELFNKQLTEHTFDCCEFPLATYLRTLDTPQVRAQFTTPIASRGTCARAIPLRVATRPELCPASVTTARLDRPRAVAPTVGIERGIAVRAHDPQVLEPVVIANAVDVVKDKAHRTPHPLFALAAQLAHRLLEAFLQEAALQMPAADRSASASAGNCHSILSIQYREEISHET